MWGRREPKTRIAYFVPLSAPKLPEAQAIMVESMKPPRGQLPRIGPTEALMFSDIRFGIWLIDRAKNLQLVGQLFPDESVVAMAKIEFIDEKAVYEPRALIFVPTVAETVARLVRAPTIVDVITGNQFDRAQFSQLLDEAAGGDLAPLHLVIEDDQLIGLKKVGIDLLRRGSGVSREHLWSVGRDLLTGRALTAIDSVAVNGCQMGTEIRRSRQGLVVERSGTQAG